MLVLISFLFLDAPDQVGQNVVDVFFFYIQILKVKLHRRSVRKRKLASVTVQSRLKQATGVLAVWQQKLYLFKGESVTDSPTVNSRATARAKTSSFIFPVLFSNYCSLRHRAQQLYYSQFIHFSTSFSWLLLHLQK